MKTAEPFPITESLGRALQLYAENFCPFLGIASCSALAAVICGVVQTLLDLPAWATMISGVLVVMIQIWGGLVLIRAIHARSVGEEPDIRALILETMTLLPAALPGALIFLVLVTGGFVLLIVPAIFFYTTLYFFIYVQALENKGLWASFFRSYALTMPVFWRVCAVHGTVMAGTLAVFIPVFFGMVILETPAIMKTVFLTALGAVIAPVFTGFYLYLFEHCRRLNDGGVQISITTFPGPAE